MVLPEEATGAAERVYRRVAWRLIPFLFLCYICAYLDRVNVGFAKLQMLDSLGLSETVYGFGAGVFFIGYFIFGDMPTWTMLTGTTIVVGAGIFVILREHALGLERKAQRKLVTPQG